MFEFKKVAVLASILLCCSAIIPQQVRADYCGMLGDVNGDHRADSVDASQVLLHYAKASTDASFDDIYISADVDGNDVIDAIDASIILKYYADKSTAYEDSDFKFTWPINNNHFVHGPFCERLRPNKHKVVYAKPDKESLILSVLNQSSDFKFFSSSFTESKWKKIRYSGNYVGYIYIEDPTSYANLIIEPIGFEWFSTID